MRKKIISGMGIFVISAFLGTSCSLKLPTFDTQTDTTVDKNQTPTGSGNQQANSDNTDGSLDGKASDANPIPAATATPSPSGSGASASPTPTPSSSSSTVITGKSGQLNIIINPNPPVQR